MFELTNKQRECFAQPLVSDTWVKRELTPSRYHDFKTFAYVEGNRVRKMITVSDREYREFGKDEMLSDDGTMLLPKTAKGKPVPLTAATLMKRTTVGMALDYCKSYLCIFNADTECDYYYAAYDGITLRRLEDFIAFVDTWCRETTEADLRDIRHFAEAEKRHAKFLEGDFFRFRINRKLFGYGRILLDYSRWRREKRPFWDIFMGKPLCVGVYHIATERRDVSPDELAGLKMLPSQLLMDNIFYYGTCEIIGNRPLEEKDKDYPIQYGRDQNWRNRRVMYQCGETWLTLEGACDLFPGNRFYYNGYGFNLNVRRPVLLECIEKDSNMPYWNQPNLITATDELRNPKNANELREVRRQFGLEDV